MQNVLPTNSEKKNFFTSIYHLILMGKNFSFFFSRKLSLCVHEEAQPWMLYRKALHQNIITEIAFLGPVKSFLLKGSSIKETERANVKRESIFRVIMNERVPFFLKSSLFLVINNTFLPVYLNNNNNNKVSSTS